MKRKKTTLPILLPALLVVLVYFFLPIHKVFTFTEYRTVHPKTYYIEMGDEQEFQIRYVHSIFLTDVIELMIASRVRPAPFSTVPAIANTENATLPSASEVSAGAPSAA